MHTSDSPPFVTRGRGHTLIRRLFPMLGLMLLVLVGLGCYLLVESALRQDNDTQQRARVFISRTFTQLSADLTRNVSDHAHWREAYHHLHEQLDIDWAYRQKNLGDSLFRLYGYEGVLVVDPQNRIPYAVINGKHSDAKALDWLEGDLTTLLAEARAPEHRDSSLVGVLEVAGSPALVGAAAITRDDDTSPSPGEPTSVLLFVDVLNPTKLATLSQTYGLPPLKASPRALTDHDSMALLDSSAQLNWMPPRPGLQLIERTVPLFAGGALALALIVATLLRQTLRSARQLDRQFDDLRLSQADLAQSEQRFRDIAEAASDWLWEIDAQYRLTYLSERFNQVTGEQREAWIGRPLAALLSPHADTLAHWLARIPCQSTPAESLLCHYLDRTGRERTCKVSARAVPVGGFRGTATDLTDQTEALAQVQHLSWHDPLTGLPNRHRLHQFLDTHLGQDAGHPLVLLSLDLDRFKPVNDTMGHAAGDLVLQDVAQRLRQNVQGLDFVARLGGDEFVVVLTRTPDEGDITRLCIRLLEQLRQPFTPGGQPVFIGASIGIAMAPRDAQTPAEILRLADVALYQAKAAGRNTWRFYAEEMNDALLARRQLEHELRHALREGQFCVHYQPRHATANGQLRGFEALVRWQHPQRGLLMPDTFIPLAEDIGLMQALGRWVLDTACREAAGWPEEVGLSVNLSPRQFDQNEDLLSTVSQALFASGLPAGRLELEITERVLLDDAQGALETLTALKGLGVRLALDDFGTGFSSLAYLRRYPLDGIKIDRSFIANLTTHGNDLAIVHAMIDLGRSLELTVTAEGVETSAQLECLRRHPCEDVQGFHFSQALPAHALAPLLMTAAGHVTP